MQTFDESYEINEDLTQAILEKIRDRLDFARKVEEHDGDAVAAVLDDLADLDSDRFYGTVLNEETLKFMSSNFFPEVL